MNEATEKNNQKNEEEEEKIEYGGDVTWKVVE